MRSNDSSRDEVPASDLAARIAEAIDACADAYADPGGADLAAHLAAAWTLIAEADPGLAELAARYRLA